MILSLFATGCVYADEPPPLEINEEFYGVCEDDYGRIVCRDEEPFCDAYPDPDFPDLYVCTSSCSEEDQCPVPTTGDATVVCRGNPAGCVLECGEGQTCPDGMQCAPTGTCMQKVG